MAGTSTLSKEENKFFNRLWWAFAGRSFIIFFIITLPLVIVVAGVDNFQKIEEDMAWFSGAVIFAMLYEYVTGLVVIIWVIKSRIKKGSIILNDNVTVSALIKHIFKHWLWITILTQVGLIVATGAITYFFNLEDLDINGTGLMIVIQAIIFQHVCTRSYKKFFTLHPLIESKALSTETTYG